MHHVMRWHCNPDARLRNSGDTVDGHEQRVMAMCHDLAEWLGMSLIGSDLLLAARHHDEAEKVLGDMPAPAKAQFPELVAAYEKAEAQVLERMGLRWSLTIKEGYVLDLCDKLDAWLWAAQRGLTGQEWDDALHRLRVRAESLGASDWLDCKLRDATS